MVVMCQRAHSISHGVTLAFEIGELLAMAPHRSQWTGYRSWFPPCRTTVRVDGSTADELVVFADLRYELVSVRLGNTSQGFVAPARCGSSKG